MKRLLLPLLAAIALPTAANAESVWLVLSHVSKDGSKSSMALEKVEMRDMPQCREEGRRWDSAENIHHTKDLGWHCVRGK